MNSKQRRKERRKGKRQIDSYWFSKWKNDKRCINARHETRKHFPNFDHCGNGGNGYVMLVCHGCPEFEEGSDK